MDSAKQSAASSSTEDCDKREDLQSKEELDFCSPKFNPLKALFSPDVKVPFENVKAFASIAIYEAAIQSKRGNSRNVSSGSSSSSSSSKEKVTGRDPILKVEKSRSSIDSSKKYNLENATTSKIQSNVDRRAKAKSADRHGTPSSSDIMGRQGGRGKMPVDKKLDTDLTLRSFISTPPEYDKHKRNVLTRMAYMSGPLELLARSVKVRLPVRVMTRAAVSVRSICRGYIVAFDKSCNMAMIDVDEVYRRPACLGKVRARITHKLQAAQKTLKEEREEQRNKFMTSNLCSVETGTSAEGPGGKQFTQIKEESDHVRKRVTTDKGVRNERSRKSVYDGVPFPYSNYEREALMLGIPDENVDHRHVNQMFIRGENVVLVSIIDD